MKKRDTDQDEDDYLGLDFMDKLENIWGKEPDKGVSGWETRISEVHKILRTHGSRILGLRVRLEDEVSFP